MIVLSAITLMAQERGDRFFGSTIGFSFTNQNNTPNVLRIGANPELGIFMCKKLRVAIAGTYTFQRQNVDNDGNYLTNVIGFGPMVSYYGKITDKFFYTPEIIYLFCWESLRFNPAPRPYTITAGGNIYTARPKFFGISPVEFEFHPTDKIGISVNIFSLTSIVYGDEADEKPAKDYVNSAAKIDFGFTPTVGFMYYFGKKDNK